MAAYHSVDIAHWLGTLSYVPSVQAIQERWQVHRTTAYRWRRFGLDKMAHPHEPSSVKDCRHRERSDTTAAVTRGAP